MRRSRHIIGLLAVVATLALVGASCGSDDEKSASSTTESTAKVPQGGTLTLGWEQEPDCTDWINSCGGSSYGYWAMGVTTMPRSFDITWDGEKADYKASSLLTGEPKLETDPKQVVTYQISPKAVWSDGTPITSTDFKYTWEQIAGPDATDVYDATGYDKIDTVDDSDPATVVVTFKEPYAGWKSLFGSGYGIMPSHLLQGKDRNAEMKDGYSWSGGPFKIEKWEKGVGVTLVPNDKWWGDKPKLDKIEFKFITDTGPEFKALVNGDVDAIYPQPQLDAIEQINAGLPDIDSKVTIGPSLEALWMNNAKAPFDNMVVRQAVAYSIDRDAVVKKLFGGIGVDKASQSLEPVLVGKFTDLEAFSKYKKDLKKVDELMTGDGWAKGDDGIWAKGGTKASFAVQTTAGNARRELTEQVVQTQLKEAGFDMTIENQKAGDLFGQILPGGDYQVALYAQVLTSLEPGACTLFCDKNNPDKNGGSGQNWQRVLVERAEKDLLALDTELDTNARSTAGKNAMKALAEDAVSLPLDPLPTILLWNKKKVVGAVSDNPVLGPLWNVQNWGVTK